MASMEHKMNRMKQFADEHSEMLKLQKVEAQPEFRLLFATAAHYV